MAIAEQHLAQYGVSMELARDFLMSNLNNLQFIHDVCLQFGVNNDMIAEILADDLPGLTGEMVSSFFDLNGFDGDSLGFNDDRDENPTHQIIANDISGVGELPSASTYGVAELLYDYQIDVSDNNEITYSFNTQQYGYPQTYEENAQLINGWSELTNDQKNTVRSAFETLETLLDITFTEVPDTSADSDGDIQFSLVDSGNSSEPGFTIILSSSTGELLFDDTGGDIFLSNTLSQDDQSHHTIIHEIGHALGLKHPFEGTYTLPNALDDYNHSIMSYSPNDNLFVNFSYDGNEINAETSYIYPEFYSLYDVAALQTVYGANTTTNTNNDTYSYSYFDYTFHTIWDAGGEDTIDLSSTSGSSTVDLNPGTINSADQYTVDEVITIYQQSVAEEVGHCRYKDWIEDTLLNWHSDFSPLYTGENNLAITTGTIIENIATGSGNDTIIDNSVSNEIMTNDGDDTINIGNGGNDTIDAGEGNDYLNILFNRSEVSIYQVNNTIYEFYNDTFYANVSNIEFVGFNDLNYTSIDNLIV